MMTDKAWLQLTLSSKKQRIKESIVISNSFNSTSTASRKLSYKHLHSSLTEDVYGTPNEPLKTLVQQSLQTQQVYEELRDQLRPLGQKYINMLLGRNRDRSHLW